jgi:tRNA-splicing ligase RtcB
MTSMLAGGAKWAIERGFGRIEDLERIEESGCAEDADPAVVSDHARKRQRREMGTLGSGNHYLEVQEVAEIFDAQIAAGYGQVVRAHDPQRFARPRSRSDGIPARWPCGQDYGIDCPT